MSARMRCPRSAADPRQIIEEDFPNVVWIHSHVAVEADGRVRTFCLLRGARSRRRSRRTPRCSGAHVDGVFEVAGDVTPADFPPIPRMVSVQPAVAGSPSVPLDVEHVHRRHRGDRVLLDDLSPELSRRPRAQARGPARRGSPPAAFAHPRPATSAAASRYRIARPRRRRLPPVVRERGVGVTRLQSHVLEVLGRDLVTAPAPHAATSGTRPHGSTRA